MKPNEKDTTKKGGKKFNGKRYQRRTTFSKREDSTKEVERPTSNAPEWHIPDSKIVRDAGTFPFSQRLGSTLQIDAAPVDGKSRAGTMDISGVMSFKTVLSPGVSQDAGSAVNLAMVKMYSWIRHMNSGHANYDPVDLGVYLACVTEAYAWLGYMIRVYAVARSYSYRNKYMPDTYLRAMNMDPEDVQANLAQLRYYINTFIVKLQIFKVPSSFRMLTYAYYIYSNIFRDSNVDAKSQVYIYTPAGYRTYDELTEAGAARMQKWAWGTGDGAYAAFSYHTVDEMVGVMNEMLTSLNASEDVGIISGDINKAYGEQVFRVGLIDPDVQLAITFDEMVLSQIEHTTNFEVAQSDAAVASWDIKQDATVSYLVHKPFCGTMNALNIESLSHDFILNFHHDNVTSEEVLEATRFISLAEQDATSPTKWNFTTTGAAVVTEALVYKYVGDTLTGFYFHSNYGAPDPENAGPYQMLANWSHFDWAPNVYLWVRSGGGTPDEYVAFRQVYGDFANFTVIAPKDIERLNHVSLMALWGMTE